MGEAAVNQPHRLKTFCRRTLVKAFLQDVGYIPPSSDRSIDWHPGLALLPLPERSRVLKEYTHEHQRRYLNIGILRPKNEAKREYLRMLIIGSNYTLGLERGQLIQENDEFYIYLKEKEGIEYWFCVPKVNLCCYVFTRYWLPGLKNLLRTLPDFEPRVIMHYNGKVILWSMRVYFPRNLFREHYCATLTEFYRRIQYQENLHVVEVLPENVPPVNEKKN